MSALRLFRAASHAVQRARIVPRMAMTSRRAPQRSWTTVALRPALSTRAVRGASSTRVLSAATNGQQAAGSIASASASASASSSVSAPLRVALLGQCDSVFARLALVQRTILPFDLDAPGTMDNLARDPCLQINKDKSIESRVITLRMQTQPSLPVASSAAPGSADADADVRNSFELLVYRTHADLVKSLLWNGPSAPQAAILCLDACNTRPRLVEQLRENLRVLPKQLRLVVYIVRTDQMPSESKEHMNLQQLRELVAAELVTQGFDSAPATTTTTPGSDSTQTPVILGATETIDGQVCPDTASIRVLLQSMDTHLATSPHRAEPYMLAVESVLDSADQRSTVVRGWDRAVSWSLASGAPPSPGETVDLLGAQGEKLISNAVVQAADPLDAETITLRGTFALAQVRRAPEYLVASSSGVETWNEIEAELYLLTPEEGGRYAPLVSNTPVLCGLGVHPAVVQLDPSLLVDPARDRAETTPEQPSVAWMSAGINRRVRVLMSSNGVATVGQRFWLGSASNIGQFVALGRVTRLVGKLPEGAPPLTLPRMSALDRLRVAEGLLVEMMNVPQPGVPRVASRAKARRTGWMLGIASFAAGIFLPTMW